MVEIVRPETPVLQGNAEIPLSLAGSVGAGQAAIGQAVSAAGRAFQNTEIGNMARQVGSMIAAEGKRYFEESKRAHQTGVYANAMREATVKFDQARMERESQVTDKHGNPTFKTLAQDIGTIGNNVIDEIAGNIIDPEVSSKFRNQFMSYVADQQIRALKVSRRQQIGFAKQSVDQGLSGLLQQATTSPVTSVPVYEGLARQLLNDSAISGVISPEERAQKESEFVTEARTASLKNAIQQDPATATVMLKEQTPEQLGLAPEKVSELNKILDAKMRSDEIQEIKAKEAAEIEQNNQKGLVVQELEKRMEADALREDELLSSIESLDKQTAKQLKRKYINETKKRVAENREARDISLKVAKGELLFDIPPAKLDNHYKNMVESQERLLGQKLNLAQKAELVSTYKGEIPLFAKEVDSSILAGTKEQAAAAIEALTYIQDRNAHTAYNGGISKKAKDIAAEAEILNQRAGFSLPEAVDKARTRIDSLTAEQRSQFDQEFRGISEFNNKNFKDTAADELGLSKTFWFDTELSGEAATTYKHLVRDSFKETGNIEAAKLQAKRFMDATHGVSKINGSDEIYMFAPPEKLFPNIPVEKFRAQIEQEATPVLPHNIMKEDVRIFADRTTRSRSVPSYKLYYMDKELGVPVPLLNDNGTQLRWVPDVISIGKEQEVEAQIEAERLRILDEEKKFLKAQDDKLGDEEMDFWKSIRENQ